MQNFLQAQKKNLKHFNVACEMKHTAQKELPTVWYGAVFTETIQEVVRIQANLGPTPFFLFF